MATNPNSKIKTESINEVILRLLGLQPGIEIDAQIYFEKLRKKLVSTRLVGKSLPEEEDELLRKELKRIRPLKDQGYRIKIKSVKSKDITGVYIPKSLKRLPASGGALVVQNYIITGDTSDKKTDKKSGFFGIRENLSSILETLGSKLKLEEKEDEQNRKEKEQEKRGQKESSLEGFRKGISGIVSTTKKMLSPFQNIFDRIKKFIFFTILGRAFTSFLDWMKNKENQKKFYSLIDFLTKHWPAIAGLYILFGTSFGKLVRGLLKGAMRMTVALAMNIPKIISFIKKNKALSILALSAAPFVVREVSNIIKGKDQTEGVIPTKNKDLEDARTSTDQARNTTIPKFNLGGMIPQFKMGGKMTPFGMGMDFSSGVPISGAGQDNTLIAAKTGEAILTERDQNDLSQKYVDRRTGQPLNIPQYLSGRKPGYVNMGNLKFPGVKGGFFKGGMVPKFNLGGIVGGMGSSNIFGDNSLDLSSSLNSIGSIKMPNFRQYQDGGQVVGERLKKSSGTGSSFRYSPKTKMQRIFENAQRRLLDRRAARNTQYYNPLSDLFRGPTWTQRLPGHDPSSRSYNMPGYDKLKWFQLRGDRDVPTNRSRNQTPLTLKSGGFIKENSGINISGATADRQLIAGQPGEYVLPKNTVNRLGIPSIERLVAMTDSNSSAYLRSSNRRIPRITPYSSSMNQNSVINLPPIVQGAGSSRARASGYSGGTRVPSFPHVSDRGDRNIIAQIYGIEESTSMV